MASTAALAITSNNVQAAYIAYFGRPADPAGLNFWLTAGTSSTTMLSIMNDFSKSAEFKQLYAGKTGADFVNAVYQNVFGRAADAGGLKFYADALAAGSITEGQIVYNIISGAQGTDAQIVANKIAYAQGFTTGVAANALALSNYTSANAVINAQAIELARGVVANINSSATSLSQANAANTVGQIAALVATGQIYTLTEAIKVTPAQLATVTPITKKVTYIGFNPHSNAEGSTTVDNLDGNNPDGNANNLTNENVSDGGVPLYDLDENYNPVNYNYNVITGVRTPVFQPGGTTVIQKGLISYVRDLTGLDFVQLGLINVASGTDGGVNSSTQNDPAGAANGNNGSNGQSTSVQANPFAGLSTISFGGSTGAGATTNTVTITGADGSVSTAEVDINNAYFKLLTNLIFDEESNLRLFEQTVTVFPKVTVQATKDAAGNTLTTPVQVNVTQVQVAGATKTYVPIVLSPTMNNGGTRTDVGEFPNTTPNNDLIQAGRLELLHQAYIDGGAGVNTLEVDAKGYYAQPTALLNIQNIKVHNLPNVYNNGSNNSTAIPPANNNVVDVNGGSTYPYLSGNGNFQNSTFDLSRAIDLKSLTVTESGFDSLQNGLQTTPGSLTLSGIRNGAEVTVDGSFRSNLFLHFGATQANGVNLVLNNANVGNTAQLVVAHNSPTLNINSTGGGNYIHNGNLGSTNSFPAGEGALFTLNISGNAPLHIENDLNPSFHNGQVSTIDASANTGGVNLRLSNSQNVVFKGSQGSDRFQVNTTEQSLGGVDFNPNDRSVTITDAAGNNSYVVNTYLANITDGNGNSNFEVSAVVANITSGNGANDVEVTAGRLNLNLGNGNNIVEANLTLASSTTAPDATPDELGVGTVVLGDGKNTVDISASASVSVTAGNGGNSIDLVAPTVTVNAGTGADTIRVKGSNVTINSTGADNITLVGTSGDYVDSFGQADSAATGADASGALIKLALGAGATVTLGRGTATTGATDSNNFPSGGNLIAHEGSSISGTGLTLVVDTAADLRAATLSGITKVVLDDDAINGTDSPKANDGTGTKYVTDNRATLTLTDTQFKAIGAAAFSVEGAIFNTNAFLKIVVTESTSLTALGVDALPRNVDLYLELADGITVTMTAQQLHERVARNGVTMINDGNTDKGAAKVVITGGGLNFDPFNTNDQVSSIINGKTYFGGSLSDDFRGPDNSFYNVTVKSLVNGYDRPADVKAEVVLTLDSTGTAALNQAAFNTSVHNNLLIVGNQDINFTGDVNLAENFTIDFSQLMANVNNLTIAQFQDVKQIRGNGATTVTVKLENRDNSATDKVDPNATANAGAGSAAEGINPTVGQFSDAGAVINGLISSGVTKYVVADINDDTFDVAAGIKERGVVYLCDQTEGLQVMALRANFDAILDVRDAAHGLAFELQGGSIKKADGPTEFSNVGELVATYKHPNATANVVINHSVAGDTRVLNSEGISINNARTVNITVAESAATIKFVKGNTVTAYGTESPTLGAVSMQNLNLTAVSDVTITEAVQWARSIDASNVTGKLVMSLDPRTPTSTDVDFAFVGSKGGSTLTISDDFVAKAATSINGNTAGVKLIIDNDLGTTQTNQSVDLSKATLSNVTSITIDGDNVLAANNQLTLSLEQFGAVGAGNIKVQDTGDKVTLNLTGLDAQVLSLAALTTGVEFGTVSLADKGVGGVITLNPATSLVGVKSLLVPKGMTLNLTAAQYQQLAGDATTGTKIKGDAGTAITVNITDLKQADVVNGLDTSKVAAPTGTGGKLTLTVSLAENVTLPKDAAATTTAVAKVTDLTGVNTVNIGNGLKLSLPDLEDAHAKKFEGGTGSVLEFRDINAAVNNSGTTPTPAPATDTTIDASGFNVDTLRILDILAGGQNIDAVFAGLPQRVLKDIYTGDGNVTGVNQTVTIEPTVAVPGGITFNKTENDVEVANFTLNLNGGVEVTGNLDLRSSVKVDASGRPLLNTHLRTLVINSNGTDEANRLSGAKANVITGLITGQTGVPDTENNILDVTINASQKFEVKGGVVFSSVTNDQSTAPSPNLTANDNSAAVAKVTVTGTADVALNTVDTTDTDVDGLNIINNGTGTVSVTLDAAKISQLATDNDALAFTGTGPIVLTTLGNVNLSDDTLTAVKAIRVVEDSASPANTGVLTLSYAQLVAVGAGNITVVDGADAGTAVGTATLNINGYTGGAFNATGIDAKFTTVNLTLANQDVTIDPSVNLTQVDQILVPEGRTLTLTAAQFQQLEGKGTIVGVDTNGNGTVASYTVRVTGLTNADVNRAAVATLTGDTTGLDFTGITGGTGTNAPKLQITLGEPTVTLGKFDNTGALSNITSLIANTEVVLATGQSLELVNASQANNLKVSKEAAATNTTTVLRFADFGTTGLTQLNMAGYTMDVLKALATFVDGTNVEALLLNLSSAVQERYVNDPTQIGLVVATNRVVVVEAGVNVPGYLMYNDPQAATSTAREVRTLDFSLEGGSKVTGNLDLSTIDKSGSGLTQQYFDTLTLRSTGASVNTITGSITGVGGTAISPAAGTSIENNVKKVVINATQALVIEGDIFFTDRGTVANQAATLTLQGNANVTVRKLDVTDNQIGSLTIDNQGTGTLTVTGASPALFDNAGAAVADNNLSSLVFKGTGNVVLGTATTANGITAQNLKSIDASAMSGNLTLGEIQGVDSRSFTFKAGTGVTKLSLTTDTLNADDSVATGNILNASWNLDFSTATGASELRLGTNLVLGNAADLAATDRSNSVNIQLGANTKLIVTGSGGTNTLDLTQLETVSISGTNNNAIVLGKGVTLNLTAAQASGLNIVADPAIITDPNAVGYVAADVPKVTITNLGTAAYALGGISAALKPTATLAANDVTLNANTVLGSVILDLNDIDSTGTADELAGQTVRFTTVEQANGRQVIISGPEGNDAEQDTNVVWLFNGTAVPANGVIDTSKYDANLGRLWVLDTLVNGRNFEELVTTLNQSIIVRIDNNTVLTSNLATTGFVRTVEVVANTTLGNGLTFTDIDNAGQPFDFVKALNLTLGGQVNAGTIEVGNILAAPITNDDEFDTLTINSLKADSGAHYLLPALQAGQRWAPGVVTANTTVGKDEEVISVGANGTLDDIDNGNETITITYTLNGTVQTVVVNDAAIDFTNQASIAAGVAARLSTIAGVTAVANQATGVVTVNAPANGSFGLVSVAVGGTVNGLAPADLVLSNGADVAQVQTLTITDTARAGDIYSLSVTLADGGNITANYTAAANDTGAQIAAGLAAAFSAPGLVSAAAAGNVITLSDLGANNGGFSANVVTSGRVALVNGPNVVGDVRVDDDTRVARFDLGNVVVDTGTGLTSNAIRLGTVFFSDDGDALINGSTTATFTVKGQSNVTVKQLDASDTDLTGLLIANQLTNGATLTVTGGSPAFDGGTGDTTSAQNLFKGLEVVTIQTAANNNTVLGSRTATDTFAGVYGEELSLVAVTGAGNVDLGTIVGVDTASFAVDASGATGNVSLSLGTANANGVKSSTIAANGSWNFNFAPAATATVNIGAGFTFANTSNITFNNLDVLNVAGAVNLTTTNLNFTGTQPTVNVPLGSTLTLTSAQANNLNVTGEGSVVVTGMYAAAHNLNGLNVRSVDLSAVTVAAVVAPAIADTVTISLNGASPQRNHTIVGSTAAMNNITGNGGQDSITGGNLNDVLDGGAGNDTILGGNGADDITGGLGNDSLNGGAGNDTFREFEGNDTVVGGADTDTIVITNTPTAALNSATDAQITDIEVITGTADAVSINLSNQSEGFTLRGSTAAGDSLVGGSNADLIDGLAGADTIRGGLGNDTLVADSADDIIDGDNGTVAGGGTADVLRVDANFNDTSNAQVLNLEIVNVSRGGLTVDLDQQTEAFTINGYVGYAPVVGVPTNGTATTRESTTFTIVNPMVAGDSLTISGFVVSATGNATAAQVADAFRTGLIPVGVNLTKSGGYVTPTGWNGLGAVTGTGAVVTLTNTVNGDVTNFTTSSGGQGTTIVGGAGNDTITGGFGVDVLDGGAGVDSLMAGAGDDLLVGDQADALIDGGMGTDVVRITTNFTSASDAQVVNVERFNVNGSITLNLQNQTEGFLADQGAGGTFNQTFLMGAGNDTVNGNDGNDSIDGGAGADRISAGTGADTVVADQADALIDGGADADVDVLSVSVNFDDSSDAQIVNFGAAVGDVVRLEKSGLTVTLDNQTEGHNIVVFSDYTPVVGVATNGTAATPESTVYTFANPLLLGQSITINGVTVTATAAGTTAAQLASAFLGTAVTGLTRTGTSGTPAAWTGAALFQATANANEVRLANTVNGDVTDFTASVAGPGSTVTGGAGGDAISGNVGNDLITGNAGADIIDAGAGNDTIVGVEAADMLLNGGTGNDELRVLANFDDANDAQIQNIEKVVLTVSGLNVVLDNQSDNFRVEGFTTGPSTIVGGSGMDTIIGGSGDDSLNGGAGDDSVDAGGGNDSVVYGTGGVVETLLGGLGTDTLVVPVPAVGFASALPATATVSGFEAISIGSAVTFTISAAELSDNAIAMVSGVAGGGAETLQIEGVSVAGVGANDTISLAGITTSFATLSVTGGDGNDSITGSSFSDVLEGGNGIDTLAGGQGNDSLAGGAGVDNFVFSADAVAETDTITDWGNGGDSDQLVGAMGAGDRLNVTFSAYNGVAVMPVNPPTTNGTAGGGVGTVQFAASYRPGDQITITINAGNGPNNGLVSVSRVVEAGRTSGLDVALAFKNVLDGISLNVNDPDLVDGAGSSSVVQLAGGAANLLISNDNQGGDGFTVDAVIVGATGYLLDATGNAGSGVAAVNGVLNVVGSDGNDTIIGGAGDDTIEGGSAGNIAESLSGGAGNDLFIVRNGNNYNATYNGGAGTADTLSIIDAATAGYLPSDGQLTGVELVTAANRPTNGINLNLSQQSEPLNITGSAQGDTIQGSNANDTITGGSGSDRFIFAASAVANGNDTLTDLVVGAGGDVLDFSVFNIDNNPGAQTPAVFFAPFTVNPAAPFDVAARVVRLVDIPGGQNILTAAGLTQAVAGGGEYSNIDMAVNSKAVFIVSSTSGADADYIFFATSDAGGVITAQLVGITSNNVTITDYVITNFLV